MDTISSNLRATAASSTTTNTTTNGNHLGRISPPDTGSIIDESFLKTLLRCHSLQKEARRRVRGEQMYMKQVLKVFKWQRKIRISAASLGGGKSGADPLALVEGQLQPQEESFDIVRRNLWRMIARKDVILAYRRKIALREQKLLKLRSLALKCKTRLRIGQKQVKQVALN